MLFSKRNTPPGFYIYFYLRSKDSINGKAGTPYYVGKGSGRRAWSPHNINIPDDPENIIIQEYDISEPWAFIQERYFIRWFGRIDNGTGILRNLTDGGEGPSGCISTDITRERKSKSAIRNVKNGTHHLLSGKIQKNYMASLSKEEKDELIDHLRRIGTNGANLQFSEHRHPSQIKKTCEFCGVVCSTNMYSKHHGARCTDNPNSTYVRENIHLRKQILTPDGIFESRVSAGRHFGVTPQAIRRRCLSDSPTWKDWRFL